MTAELSPAGRGKDTLMKGRERLMKILLCGATAGSNFGDLLLARLFQDCVSGIVGKENTCWFRSFRAFSPFFEEHLENHNRCRFSEIDLMVYISGGYFFGQDIRLKNYIARFFRYCFIGLKCILFRKPYVIIGVEAGPSKSRLMRALQAYIIKKARYVSVRNRESWEYVRNNIREDVVYTADTALCIPDSFEDAPASIPAKQRRLLFHIRNTSAGNRSLISKLVPAINMLLEKEPFTVALSADQYSEKQKELLDEVAGKLTAADIEKYEYRDPLFLCELIKRSDVVVTTKLHVGIVGARYGCSVISFSGFTDKISRFYRQIGEPERSLSMDEFSLERGCAMLERFKDRPITLDPVFREMALQNLEELKKLILSVKSRE